MMSGDVRLPSKCWRFAAEAEKEGSERSMDETVHS